MGKRKNLEMRKRLEEEQARRNAKLGWTLSIGVTVLAVIAVAVFVTMSNSVVAAPAFNVTSTDGDTIASDALEGSVYVVDFHAVNCGICERQRPHNQALLAAMADREDFHFFSVLSDPRDTLERIEQHRAENNMTWPHVRDTYRLFHAFEVRGDPFMVFVDREGNIAHVVMEITTGEQLINIAERVLEHGADGSPREHGRTGAPPRAH
jgi:hypothetical protein